VRARTGVAGGQGVLQHIAQRVAVQHRAQVPAALQQLHAVRCPGAVARGHVHTERVLLGGPLAAQPLCAAARRAVGRCVSRRVGRAEAAELAQGRPQCRTHQPGSCGGCKRESRAPARVGGAWAAPDQPLRAAQSPGSPSARMGRSMQRGGARAAPACCAGTQAPRARRCGACSGDGARRAPRRERGQDASA